MKCRGCSGTGKWSYGDMTGTCVDCEGSGVQPINLAPSRDDVLRELYEWFTNEVAAGDESLQHWVERIEMVMTKDALALREP